MFTNIFLQEKHMITQEKAREILQKPGLKKGIEKYRYIMQQLNRVDVAADIEFQKAYKTFYYLRFCSQDFCKQYFKLMQQLKNNTKLDFETVFDKVKTFQQKNGKDTNQISFSSKLAHTINPSNPIWDSIVTNENHFNLCCDNVDTAVAVYNEYKTKFNDYLSSSIGQELIKIFDEYLPNSGISDVKKIDFILWQDR